MPTLTHLTKSSNIDGCSHCSHSLAIDHQESIGYASDDKTIDNDDDEEDDDDDVDEDDPVMNCCW